MAVLLEKIELVDNFVLAVFTAFESRADRGKDCTTVTGGAGRGTKLSLSFLPYIPAWRGGK